MGLSEIRKVGNLIEEYDDFIFHYMGETAGLYGVGFIIKKYLKKYIEAIIGLSERVSLLLLNISNFELAIIQVYSPTDAADDCLVEQFYLTINKALTLAGKRKIIVMGDFNAKIGMPSTNEKLIMKNYGYGIRNIRGERLIEFAYENKLSVINTFFKKKTRDRWTWRSPDGKTKNELDYILSNFPSNFYNIEVLNVTFPSDHRPLRAKVKIRMPKKSRASFNNNPTITLKTDAQISTYMTSLHDNLYKLAKDETQLTVQEYHDQIISIIQNSLKNANNCDFGKPSIITNRTRQLISRRRELHNKKPKTRSMKNELKALYKIISKYIKHDYSSFRSRTIERHLNSTGSLKRAYKELRTHKNWIEGLQNQEKIYNSRDAILNIATSFYKNLYNYPTNTQTNNIEKLTSMDYSGGIEPINEAEMLDHIRRMKSEKSPGTDKITNEAIKIGHQLLVTPLVKLFNLILTTISTPHQWSESNIILLYKKGNPKDISNYRPISLLPSLYKLFSSIIEKRISQVVDSKQPMEQAGFRKGFSTIDHIHTLEQIIEKYQEFRKPLYICFIDYQKAFDTLSHDSIWGALLSQNVNIAYIKILKHIYEKCRSRIQLESIGPPIEIKRGVRQGDPLSPRIFIAVLEHVMSGLNWNQMGLNIEGKYLSHLRFADDIVLMSECSKKLEYMISTLREASRKVGLEINLNKTKIITNSKVNPIKLNNIQLELTDERWTKRATEWTGPQGYRRVGRPLARWADDLRHTAGRDWLDIAKDRDTWHSLEEAFT
ncbi:unnamed protein product [Euphydryas editha]|uniref:Reverse transcriptase domain-containing protein n=1 Tax=Euphydryas editha TaxID=104508 RepID=A0AAU9V015_EUPED|nr:unnamed protein product [Euphydryas editha]